MRMQRYIAMLRGINLGSHNRLAMPALKAGFEELGLLHVATYLQSGNVAFASDTDDSGGLALRIHQMIEARFGHDVTILLRSAGEMDRVSAENPFLSRQDIDLAKLHVTFLSEMPTPERLSAIRPELGGDDEWLACGAAVYLHCPNGYGRTKLTNGLFEQKLKVPATTRNWKTVLALRDLANGSGG